MKKIKKKIIIFSTEDNIVSIPLVYHVVSQKKYEKFKFEIFFMKPNLFRKLKVLTTIFLFGSILDLFRKLYSRKTINDLKKFKNVNIINEFNNKSYDYGLSINYTKKLILKKYKIYNFHLGSLYDQRGAFIFFYKFIYAWKTIYLTFHEIGAKFDKGYIYNEKKIEGVENMNASEVLTVYLENLDFLDESIDKIGKGKKKKLKKNKKLHTIPTLKKIFLEYFRLRIFA